MKKITIMLSLTLLAGCGGAGIKSNAVNAKDDFKSCAKEQALIKLLNPTTAALSTDAMAKQVSSYCRNKLRDQALGSEDFTMQLAVAAITAAKSSRDAHKPVNK